MLNSLKNRVLGLAKEAVLKVEKNFNGEDGKYKKQVAVDYVINHLPVPDSVKFILGFVLSVFIDSAIEIAVAYMNDKKIVEE